MAYQFGVLDVLEALGVTAADFDIQNYDPAQSGDEASVSTRVGAISAGTIKHTNPRIDGTLVLISKVPAGATVPTIALGGGGTGVAEPKIVLLSVVARQTFNGYASLTVRFHQHPGSANAHLTTPAAVSVTLPLLGFGILDGVCVDDVGETGSEAPADNLQSVEYTAEMQHVDRQTRQNAFLVGASFGFKESATVEYIDDGTDLTVSTGWVDALTGSNPSSNADMKTKSIRCTKQAA